MADTGYFSKVCFCRLILASTLCLWWLSACFSWSREGTFLTGDIWPAFRQIGRWQRGFPGAAVSQLPSAQKDQYTKAAYFGVAYSDSFHLVYLLITHLTCIDSLFLSSFLCVIPLESLQTAQRQTSQFPCLLPYGQFLKQPKCPLLWFIHPSVSFSCLSCPSEHFLRFFHARLLSLSSAKIKMWKE